MIKKIFIIFTALITLHKNNILFASDKKDGKIPLEALEYLLIPRDEELRKKIVNQYELLLKQMFPVGLTSIELEEFSSQTYKCKSLDFCNPILFEENNTTFLTVGLSLRIERKNIETHQINKSFNLSGILLHHDCNIIAATKNNYIALFSDKKFILIKPNEEIKLLENHKEDINSLSFSSDCKYLVSGGYRNILIWELENEKDIICKALKNEHISYVSCKLSKEDKCLATSCSEKICLWNMDDLSRPISVIVTNYYKDNAFDNIVLSNDNKYLIAGTSIWPHNKEAKAIIWGIENPYNPIKKAETNKLGDEKIYIAISNNSQYFITSCHANILLWKINNLISGNKEPISTIRYESLNRDTPCLSNLEFSKNDKYLACNSYMYDLSKFWIVNNLNLDQINVIIILAFSNNYEKELKENENYRKIFLTLDRKIITHLHKIFDIRQFLLSKITKDPFVIFNSYYHEQN